MDLFAQAAQSNVDWAQLLARNGVWVFLIVGIVGGVASSIVAQMFNHRVKQMKHRERMALINAGIHPDYPPDQVPNSQPEAEMHGYRGRG